MNTKETLDATLDDAAAFFVQLEKNDLSELAQLKEMLDTIIDSDSCPESSSEDIKKAVQTIEGIIFKYISDTDSAIEKIGKYIDSAINAADEIENRDQEDNSVNDENHDQVRENEDSDFFQIPDSAFTDFIDEFVVEGIDLIASAEEALLVLENNLLDRDALDNVFRAFHSIKGSAALLKFDIISELAHQAENLLDRMRCEEIQCTGGYADLVFKSLDMLREFFNIIKNTSAGETVMKPDGYEELKRLLENPDEYIGDDVNIELPTEVSSEQENVEKKVIEDLQSYMPEDVDFDLIAEFITEGSDLVANAEEALLVLESDPDEMSAVDTVFRAFHTVKGTSGFLDLTLLSKMGHYAETLLSRVREREIRYEGVYADLALRALDMIKDLMTDVETSLNGSPLLKPDGYDALIEELESPEGCSSSENDTESFESQTGDMATYLEINGNEKTEKVETPRLGDILVSEGKIERERLEEIVANKGTKPIGEAILECKAATATDVNQAIRTQFRMKRQNQKTIQASIRVATDRLDRLINMVGELVIAYSMVSEDDIVASSDDHEFQKKVSHASKIVRELQNMTMSLRMVPLKPTFNKMSRLVRDVSRKFGKKVNFVIEGEDTEIDRNMADAIKDPLVHMVRNAVDHGIENPDERERIGKDKEGTVKLSAYHSAGNVVVEIEDDGKGLDREMILTKSIERGLVSEDTSLSEREIFNMIFEPGFSTAKAITDVSGRGVGMDVVRKNIEAIRGQTEIQSELGKGSLFQMRLPLTLAIIDGMAIGVGTETYVIPTTSIVTSIKPEPGSVSTVLDKGEMLTLQGKLIPLFRLRHLFHIDSETENKDIRLVVVVEEEGRLAGLVIDELYGRQQVVIKTLGETMRNIHGIAGGAIMPNGRVGLIMDVGGVVKLANSYDGEKVKAVA
jgi:two-component system chemotaxis sensor kinase CheA